MRFVVLAAALATLTAACDVPPVPGEDDVVTVASIERDLRNTVQHADFEKAWHMVGGVGFAPKIVLVEDADLNCPEGGDRFVEPGLPGCWGGLYWADGIIKVTRRSLWERLAHELRHAAKYQATGDVDYWHSGLGGEAIRQWDIEVVGPAQSYLRARGWF
jgi:hypothetical protein